MMPMEPGSLVMERKMLRGIKQRADRSPSCIPEEPRQPAESNRSVPREYDGLNRAELARLRSRRETS